MSWDLLIALLVIGAGVIGWLVWDAKRKEQVRRERWQTPEETVQSYKAEGFDADGIGKVRRVGRDSSVDELNKSEAVSRSQQESPHDSLADTLDEPLIATREDALAGPRQPRASASTTQSKPAKPHLSKTHASHKAGSSTSSIKREEIPEDDTLEGVRADEQKVIEPELVIALVLMSPEGTSYQGPELLQAMLSAGLRHGDMNIFHRHKEASGRGAIQFSVASAVNPGTFDLDAINQFSTPGLTFFLTLPGPTKPIMAYQLMLQTAEQLRRDLGGQLLDGQRSVMTAQTKSHHQELIRDFERRELARNSH